MIRIATRGSALALWQANWVRERLRQLEPALAVDLVIVKTRGDQIIDRALSEVGGKGLFVKEIEEALLDGRAEVAVHSMKDLPGEVAEGLLIAAVPAREDPRDALVVAPQLDATCVMSLPRTARVGTSSLRRVCQLLTRRPDLHIVPLRGNVDTRLKRVAAYELDAIVLACAGLRRLGHADRITAVMSIEESVPAVGQGALAIECRADDVVTRTLLAKLDDATTARAVKAERAFLRRLEGDCKTPLGAHAVVEGDALTMTSLLGAPDGSLVIRRSKNGHADDGDALGRALAEEILAAGGEALLKARAAFVVGGE